MSGFDKLERIAVLVSVGSHRVSGLACYSRNDAVALELGRSLARTHGSALDVLHAGDPSNAALADYLALGAERIEVLACGDDDDAVPALARRLQGCGLVLTGTRAEGAYDSGMLPYRLAVEMGYALIGSALDVSVAHGRVAVKQFLPKGVRRSVDAPLPAVIAVHPQASAAPRYAHARAVTGSISRCHVTMEKDADAAHWSVAPVQRKPVKLTAPERRSGHARMLSATTTEGHGGSVVIDGTSVEKAQVILGYLREHQLIDY